MSRLYIGVDPGVTGAWAIVSEHYVDVHDLPILRDGRLAWIDGLQWLADLRSAVDISGASIAGAMVEKITPLPQNGRMGAFSQGCTLGSILSILPAAGIPVHFTPPGHWKKHFGLSKDKDASLNKARLLYPTMELARKKDHNRAEALLIARYASEVIK